MVPINKLKEELFDIFEKKDITPSELYQSILKLSLINKEKDFVTSRDGVELNQEVDFDWMESILTLDYDEDADHYGAKVNPGQFQAVHKSMTFYKKSDEEGARKWVQEAVDGTEVHVAFNYAEHRIWKETYRKKEGKWYKVFEINIGLELKCLSPGIWFYAGIRQDAAKDLEVEFDDDFQLLFDHVLEYMVKN
jgi:hypothetical protein